MKKQIKDLTMDEMNKICSKQSCSCQNCPLKYKAICYKVNSGCKFYTRNFLNKEIEVEND